MSSTPNRFTRYDAEHHDPATEYVLASEYDAETEQLRMQLVACGVVAMANTPETAARARDMHPEYMSASCRDVMLAIDREMSLRAERNELARLRDRLLAELEAANRQLAALSYPVALHTNPLLTVESGGIRYVLEAMSDEDGDWFDVKSATPTEPMTLETFTVLPMCVPATCRYTAVEAKAREALAAYRAAQREDDEASPAY